jgi:hypothetical protein
MTLFNGVADTAPSTAPPKEPEKPAELKVVIPPSRIQNDPEMWREAMEFASMLTYCRPHGSKAERKFIAKYLIPLGVMYDKFGNYYKQIGDNPSVLWSSHTDTVHTTAGSQKIIYWPNKFTGDIFFGVDQPKVGEKGAKRSSCMGADDTCGIWLMIQMIKANVPGLYIFHRAEEIGGKGSGYIAEKNKDALKGIRFAIAFDRRGEKSVITYQRSKRCCSDEFAKSLAEQLGMGHTCDTTGSFTDTASYVDLVAECTNISVGYDGAHTSSEDTNVDYLFRLRDALLKLDISKLVEKRKPGENTSLPYTYQGNYNGSWDGWGGGEAYGYQRTWKDLPTTAEMAEAIKRGGINGFDARKKHKGTDWLDHYDYDNWYGLWFPKKRKTDLGVTKTYKGSKPTYQETLKMIRENAAVIADLLETVGYSPMVLKEYLLEVGASGQIVSM